MERRGSPSPSLDNIEPAFVAFGYSECLGSFLTFGMFKLARQSGVLPEALFAIFDHVMEEEARHIVFFVNWVAYRLASQGQGAAVFRATRALWYYGKALRELLRAIREADKGGESFVATGANAVIDEFTPVLVLSACLEEHTRRMRSFDSRLLQPQFMPTMADMTLRGLKLLPRRQSRIAKGSYR